MPGYIFKSHCRSLTGFPRTDIGVRAKFSPSANYIWWAIIPWGPVWEGCCTVPEVWK